MKIVRYESSMHNEWNSFLEKCKNTHFMFHRDFMDYHAHRFKDMSLMVYDEKDKVIALLPANYKDNILFSHQGLTFGGLLIEKDLSASSVLKIFSEIKSFLKQQGVREIVYKCIPIIYHQYPAQEDLYALFINNAELYRRDISSCIDLARNFQYRKGKKASIKKAQRSNLIFKEIEKPSLGWKLLREVLIKHNASPVHTEEEIDLLKSRFPMEIRSFVALLEDRILAFAVTFVTREVFHTQYLACGDEGRELGALDFLISEMINESKKYVKYFSFGISNEQNGRYLNEGLISQKEGFGARGIIHDFYRLEIE